MRYSLIGLFDEIAEQSPTRMRNLKYMHQYYSAWPDSEYFIIRQTMNLKSKPSYPNMINVYNPGIGNLGWAANIGAKMAKGEFLVFADCDWVNHHEDMQRALELLEKHEVVNPNTLQRRLTEEETQGVINGKYNWTRHIPNTRIAFGCPALFRRSAFPQTGGYFELDSWGILDSGMDNIARSFLDHAVNKGGRAVHMWHTRDKNEPRPHDANYKRCYEVYAKLRQQFHDKQYEQIKNDCKKRWETCGNPGRFK